MKRLLLLLSAMAGCASSHAREGLPIDIVARDAATDDGSSDGKTIGASAHKDMLGGLPILGAPSGTESSSDAGNKSINTNAADAATTGAALPLPDAGTPDDVMVWIGEAEETVTYPEIDNGSPP